MTSPDLSGLTLGQRVAELRRIRGLSQRDLAVEVSRSESWVSQVERDVLPVERVSVLQILADALGASVAQLRPEAAQAPRPTETSTADELGELRLAMTGHPALRTLLGTDSADAVDLRELTATVDEVWQLTHSSQFRDLEARLGPLLKKLESGVRQLTGRRRKEAAALLNSAYLAASAAFARQDEADAAWLAADRAARWAEDAGDPFATVVGNFRMGHAFITLRRPDQAERAATDAIAALRPLTDQADCAPQALSLYGAMHLVLAVVHAREGNRSATRSAIDTARAVAARLGEDRNDYNTEFGPTNVELHAVATAVDLGDAGEALDIAAGIDASGLSLERQSRLAIDLARAHIQRRQIGDAVAALLEAERHAPEQVPASGLVRALVADLLRLAGRRATPELTNLARRSGVTA
jgi:transcriptional regulator with XRE-family HTH domain